MTKAIIAPNSAPGKKPATTALLGKEGHDEVEVRELVVSFEAETDGDGTGAKVAAVADIDVAVLDVLVVVVVAVVLSRTQVLFPVQE